MDEGAACRGMQRRPSHAECNVTVVSARVTWCRSHVAAAVAVESAISHSRRALSPILSVRGRRSFSTSHFTFSYLESSEIHIRGVSLKYVPFRPLALLFLHVRENILETINSLFFWTNF